MVVHNYRLIWRVLLIAIFLATGTFQTSAIARVKNINGSLAKPMARPEQSTNVHNVGTIWNMVTNYGQYGDPNSVSPSMEWPGGSEAYYLWEGRFWAGGIVNGEKLVSHADYGNYEWYPKDGSTFDWEPNDSKSIQDGVVEYDDLYGIAGHTPMGIEVYERSLAWSMGDYDDFIAYEYEVRNVSENVIDGFFVSWVYDCDVAQLADPSEPHLDDLVDYDGWDGPESDKDLVDVVDPMDLDGDDATGYDEWGWPYGFPHNSSGQPTNPNYDASLAEPDGFYDAWQVLLDSEGPILRWQASVTDLERVAGEIAVVDGDTLKGYLLPRNSSYMYDDDYAQSPENDIGERGGSQPIPGFIGGRILYSDIINQTDVFPYRTTEEDTFMRPYAHQWWNWESDPGDDIEKYDYMSANHSASTQLGKHYYFLPNPFEVNAPVFDYRFLLSTGPFNQFAPGEVLRFVMVAAVGNGLQGMRQNLDFAMKAYYEGSKENPDNPDEVSDPYHPADWQWGRHWVLPIPPVVPGLVYSPATDGAAIELSWDNLPELTIDAMLNSIDFEGYKIYRSLYNASSWEMIYACDNREEPVLVKDSDGNIINELDSNGDPILVDLPAITHTYRDEGGTFLGREISTPVYGLQYFYAVVAYDPDKAGLPSQESSKSNYLTNEKGAPLAVVPRYAPVPDDMQNIKVVPNPYKGTALFESRYEDKIMFTNLPPACKISIFTLAGDLVDTIYHGDGYGDELWSLISRNQQKVVSGLYIYVVERDTPGHDYDKFIGKFVIIR